MTDRELMQQALEWADKHGEIVFAGGGMDAVDSMNEWAQAMRSRLAQPEQGTLRIDRLNQWLDASLKNRKPLTDEQIEQAYQHIWRNLPDDFDHTSMGWIEQGIRYAEQAHGIKENT